MPSPYSLYLVVNQDNHPEPQLLNTIKAAIKGGITCIQLRAKTTAKPQIFNFAKTLKSLTQAHHIPFIINDHLDIALACNADGLHIGQNDIDAQYARQQLGPNKILGLSIENLEQAKQHQNAPVNYFGIGPIFTTTSKNDAAPAIGIQQLKQICQILNKPCIAIGGIQSQHLEPLIQTGIQGIAVVSAIMQTDNPTLASQKLKCHFTPPIVLTIAGSDSSGGAGIQADIKTILANQGYAASLITCITAQNTQGVIASYPSPSAAIEQQGAAIMSDLKVSAIKIGMLHNVECIQTVAKLLHRYPCHSLVLDPVMVSSTGHPLIEPEAIQQLCSQLFPLATLITPNLAEAETLLQRKINSLADMQRATKDLAGRYQTAILLKGGHAIHLSEATDIFISSQALDKPHSFKSPFIETTNTHGTGCTLSAAIATQLAHGNPLITAIKNAKAYLSEAITQSKNFAIGHGNGPLHHLKENQ